MRGRIPKQFIDDLLLRVDIVDIIDARVPLKKAGKDHKACCPFHEEKTPSFTVSAGKQFYHCFGCGAHGTAISFLMEYDHMSFPEAVEDLARHVGVPLPEEAATVAAPPLGANLLPLLEEAARYYQAQWRSHPHAAPAAAYLKGRGINGEVAQAFGLGYAPEGWDNLVRVLGKSESEREALVQAGLAAKKDGGGYYDRFRDRVVFPIHDYRGRIVGFGGRVIGKGEPKYLNSPETALFHKGRELYGLYRARDAVRREGRVLVVEGYMDVVALAQFGIDYAVATLGTATTRDHLERIFRFVPEVVFCFDGDRAGREAAWRALENALPVLHEGRQASFLFLPEGDDPDTLIRKEGTTAFVSRIPRALPLPDFLFQTLARDVDLDRLDGRARLAELARPLLSKMPAGLFAQMMWDRLAEIARVNVAKLGGAPVMVAPAPVRPRRLSAGGPQRPASMVRVAVALLIQHPELAAQLPDPALYRDLDLPGMELFRALVEVLEQQPKINTPALVERFRDTEYGQQMARLATWEHPVLEQDVATEFAGVVTQMAREAARARVDRLLQKQRAQGLTSAEKVELARLLAEKPAIQDNLPKY